MLLTLFLHLYLHSDHRALDTYFVWIIFEHPLLFLLLTYGPIFWILRTLLVLITFVDCLLWFSQYPRLTCSKLYIWNSVYAIILNIMYTLRFLIKKIFFTAKVNLGLKKLENSNGDGHLNRNWYWLKSTLLNTAWRAFPKWVISLNKPQDIPFEFKPFIHLSHKLNHYISSLFKIFSISNLYISWNRFSPSFCREFFDFFPDQTELVDGFLLPAILYSIYISLKLEFLTFWRISAYL